jgi:hypothetical protein
VHELREITDGVLAHGDLIVRTEVSDVPIRQHWAVVCGGFRDGQIGEWRWFQTLPEALTAAGLKE